MIKRFYPIVMLCLIFFTKVNAQKVTIDTLFQDKISIRAILIDKNKVWYAANDNRFGYFDLLSKQVIEQKIETDTLKMEFRSISQNQENIFVLNVGNPAQLYKISKKDLTYKKVYTETDKKVFYDSMQFWDNKSGIAIGDPINDCLSIIITNDKGNNWQKIPCESLPKTAEGEAAFAASNTNIIVKNNKIWVVSGGKKSRVFYSENKGKSWQVSNTPIVQGDAMTGIFSADFYNENIGIAVGGNYEAQSQNFGNKAITIDGGKNWKLIADNKSFGYASCVQFVPKSNGNKIISVGGTGVFYSKNQGETWTKISDDTSFYTIRFIDKKTAVAAGKNKMVLLRFIHY